MDAFWAQLVAPFLLVAMLVIAYPFKRLVMRMRDSKLKRLLLARIR
jgi:hypothetical protein